MTFMNRTVVASFILFSAVVYWGESEFNEQCLQWGQHYSTAGLEVHTGQSSSFRYLSSTVVPSRKLSLVSFLPK